MEIVFLSTTKKYLTWFYLGGTNKAEKAEAEKSLHLTIGQI